MNYKDIVPPVVSVITPFYNGNQYIQRLLAMMEDNAIALKSIGAEMEYILVNDSPEIEVEYDRTKRRSYRIRCMKASHNLGIHGARVIGIRCAYGEYIQLLDQDDIITQDWLKSQLLAIKDYDMVVSNSTSCFRGQKVFNYKRKAALQAACNKWFMCLYDNKITSPGQVLIKKESIPTVWLKHRMKRNGADDYFLWVAMLEGNCSVACNYSAMYFHEYSPVSVSLDEKAMSVSKLEMGELLCRYVRLNPIRKIIYKRRFKYENWLTQKSDKNLTRFSFRYMDCFFIRMVSSLAWEKKNA